MQLMPAKMQDQEASRWDDVRVFLAVIRGGSLGQAAMRLGLDTSTVSRRIAALEAALGARLFDRAREGISPTRVAELMVPAAEAMEAGHARLAREAVSAELSVEGVVRISMPPGEAETFVAPALAKLRARHPRLQIELDASARVVDLTRHEADLAVRSVRPESAELVTVKLLQASWCVAAAPALADSLGRVDDWKTLPWITWDRDLARFAPSRWLARHVPKADVALRTSHFASQLAAARGGLGVLLVPEPHLAAHGLARVTYARVLARSVEQLPVDDVWLAGLRAARALPRIDAVWAFLREELKVLGSTSRARRTSA
jgi:DNA-binding transcriptional LysR family regulator